MKIQVKDSKIVCGGGEFFCFCFFFGILFVCFCFCFVLFCFWYSKSEMGGATLSPKKAAMWIPGENDVLEFELAGM